MLPEQFLRLVKQSSTANPQGFVNLFGPRGETSASWSAATLLQRSPGPPWPGRGRTAAAPSRHGAAGHGRAGSRPVGAVGAPRRSGGADRVEITPHAPPGGADRLGVPASVPRLAAMEERPELVRDAVALMTTWDASDRSLTAETVVSMLNDSSTESEMIDRLGELVTGLISLCGLLLVRREREVGTPPAETLRMYGQAAANW